MTRHLTTAAALMTLVLFRACAADGTATSLAEICNAPPARGQTVRTTGVVVDAFQDEIDSTIIFALIKDREYVLPVALSANAQTNFKALVDCQVSVVGLYNPTLGGSGDRRFAGPFLTTTNDAAVSIVRPAPSDPFDVPELEALSFVDPRHIAALGKRRVVGVVIAAWGERSAIVRMDDRRLVKLELAKDVPLPRPGLRVVATGHPATDQFRINLHRTVWKGLSGTAAELDPPEDIPPKLLVTDDGASALNVDYYGRTVRLEGIARAVPDPGDPHGRLYLEMDEFVFAVDRGVVPSAFAGIERGAVISVTGVCLVDASNWHPYDVFPRLGEFTLVLREPDDIRVLSRPSWWRSGRLLWIVLLLLAALLATLAWNTSLKRLVERKSRLLVREEVATIRAELRTHERTRLAIELHDALSQSLTGIALQTKAAARLARTDLPTALDRLDHVQRSLGACREELRNCLWDLRSDASGRSSLDEAIRVTLQPLLGETHLNVRFNVERHILSESTVSSLLRIVRELVVNAIRHGEATAVRIAGCLDGDRIRFSVTDNGCGFDPSDVPGMDSGHFGIQGIRERLGALQGELSFESEPGTGTRATVRFVLPREPTADEDREK